MTDLSSDAGLETLKTRVDRATRRHQGLHLDSREAAMLQGLLKECLLAQDGIHSTSSDRDRLLQGYQPDQATQQLAELRKVMGEGLLRTDHV